MSGLAVLSRTPLDELGHPGDGIIHLPVLFGFQDAQDLPAVLRQVHGLAPELDHDPGTASYFLSRMTIEHGREPGMSSWRKRLFIGLSHNAANPAAYFHLPDDRTPEPHGRTRSAGTSVEVCSCT